MSGTAGTGHALEVSQLAAAEIGAQTLRPLVVNRVIYSAPIFKSPSQGGSTTSLTSIPICLLSRSMQLGPHQILVSPRGTPTLRPLIPCLHACMYDCTLVPNLHARHAPCMRSMHASWCS